MYPLSIEEQLFPFLGANCAVVPSGRNLSGGGGEIDRLTSIALVENGELLPPWKNARIVVEFFDGWHPPSPRVCLPGRSNVHI